MGLKDAFDNLTETVTNAVTGAVRSVKHEAQVAVSKAAHLSAAHAEEVKRAEAGGALTPIEVSMSVANQVREETLAQIDSIRQTVRKNI